MVHSHAAVGVQRPNMPQVRPAIPVASLRDDDAQLLEAQDMIGGMWVRLMDWMIADAEPQCREPASTSAAGYPRPRRGHASPAGAPRRDTRDRGSETISGAVPLTGSVIDPRDFEVDEGSGGKHASAEFVLAVGDDRFQVQFEGSARDIQPGSRVTVDGPLSIVGGYE